MKKIKDIQTVRTAHYLPHHCVFRSESLTIRIRVVFNASTPTDNDTLLNDIQMIGPTLQDDLFSILMRFRRYTTEDTRHVRNISRYRKNI